jgi:hypothetical protein
MKEFELRCISYGKGCGIGLIPALQYVDYEKDNFRQHLEAL